jgi:hypothetical protein
MPPLAPALLFAGFNTRTCPFGRDAGAGGGGLVPQVVGASAASA